jgi:hypothetical protein
MKYIGNSVKNRALSCADGKKGDEPGKDGPEAVFQGHIGIYEIFFFIHHFEDFE